MPACLRVVLLGHGQDYEEARLRELCDCTIFGTKAEQAVEAMRKLGFRGTSKQNLRWNDLAVQANRNALPIVFVNLLPLNGIKGEHSLIALGVTESEVTVYDPLQGERILPSVSSEAAWAAMRNLTILIAS